ncbi:MAG: NAD(P)/FAD-dependent oxidoreductase [Acidimicrobiia bacterium]|nr:NAD(P)/FAD-dependent oxidoreductase [Acidimicrobiia bacterium]
MSDDLSSVYPNLAGNPLEGIEFPQEHETDCVVIGAGPNGLIAAMYLAAAGLDVVILERRYEIGGGLATEEILFPGHLVNTHATYHFMTDYMPALTDFDLGTRGLRFHKPNMQLRGRINGDDVLLCRSLEDSRDSMARGSIKDAVTFGDMALRFRKIVDGVLGPATYLPPGAPLDLMEALDRTPVGQDMLALSEQSAVEILQEYSLPDSTLATLLYAACQWGISPQESGMGFMVPLMVDRGMQKAYSYGGSHRLASSFARVILENGGLILDNAEVAAIEMDGSRAAGVRLADGRRIHARKAVLSSLDPQTTFLRLLPEDAAPKEIRSQAESWTWDKWSLMSVFFSVRGKPTLRNADGNLSGDTFETVLGFDDFDDVVAFLESVERGEIPKIAGHFTCESAFDKTLSQVAGNHTCFFQMPAPYDYPWDARRDEIVAEVTDLLDAHFDGFRASVVDAVLESPHEIERRLPNMVRGSIKHGDYNPVQMGNMRPNTDCSATRTAVPGLYVCGASTYPGGMVLGGPGYIGAHTVCEDLEHPFPREYTRGINTYLDTYFPDGLPVA